MGVRVDSVLVTLEKRRDPWLDDKNFKETVQPVVTSFLLQKHCPYYPYTSKGHTTTVLSLVNTPVTENKSVTGKRVNG